MSNTKERILMTALRLFARDGYEAVSVSMIAGELGMTKGALYKHYKNKRDIFDSIVQRMYEIDAKRADAYEVPQEQYVMQPESYKNVTIEKVKKYTSAQFFFWLEDEFASNFRRMLALEQYRNSEMSKLYSMCVTEGTVGYLEDLFREMIAEGIIKETDPRQLAIEYFAPMYLLINLSDHAQDKSDAVRILDNHLDSFFEIYAVPKSL